MQPKADAPVRVSIRSLSSALLCLSWLVAAAQTPPRYDHIGRAQGLSQSGVHCLLRDRQGFMWFGTGNGLDRYDGYRIVSYQTSADNPESLSHNGVSSLYQTEDERIWIGTDQGALNYLSPRTGKLQRVVKLGEHFTGQAILALAEVDQKLYLATERGLLSYDLLREQLTECVPRQRVPIRGLQVAEGELWVATTDGLYTLARDAGPALIPVLTDQGAFYALAHDRDGVLWAGGTKGLFRRPPRGSWSRDPRADAIDRGLPITALATGQNGIVWIGCEDGVFRLDSSLPEGETLLLDYGVRHADPTSLSNPHVLDLFEDKDRVLWVATWGGGVNRLDLYRERFFHYRNQFEDPYSLSHDMVNAIHKDPSGTIWVGTEHGLDRLQPGNPGSFVHMAPLASRAPTYAVGDIVDGREGELWATIDNGLLHLNRQGQVVRLYEDKDMPAQGLWSMARGSEDELWIGSRQGGLLRMNLGQPGAFTLLTNNPAQKDSLAHDNVQAILVDATGAVWVGTGGGGLDMLETQATPGFRHFRHDPQKPESISDNFVLCLHQDDRGRFWVGTMSGLDLMTGENSFKSWSKKDGLVSNTIFAITHDAGHNLWLATNDGLIRFDPDTGQMATFRASDGLQSDEFNSGAATLANDGRLYFGGIAGLTAFYPEDLIGAPRVPKLVLSRMLVNNKPLPELDGVPIEFATTWAVPSDHGTVSIEFTALAYADPGSTRYAYMLEGFHREWIQVEATNRTAIFTDLKPGTYALKAKAAVRSGNWSEEHVLLELDVSAPFWAQGWAYVLYAIAFIALIAGLVRHQRAKLQQERELVERLREMDQLKDDFLANTSQELSTPLEGMIGLAESMLDGAAGPLSLRQAAQLAMVASSGRRLSGLVNDLLDFSRLKHKDLELDLTDIDLGSLVEVVFTLYNPLATDKGLALINGVPDDTVHVRADEARLKQVLSNLVANAIKFTERGEIRVSCQMQGRFWSIAVSDTGIGIAEEKQSRIFTSFEHLEDLSKSVRGGAGLGLTLSSWLIELHGGTITVQSTPDHGTVFTFTLPRTEDMPGVAQTPKLLSPVKQTNYSALQAKPATSHPAHANSRFHILIVDDDPVNRQILLNHLTGLHQRLTAVRDGHEALQCLEENRVDMVLLDIIMPGISGFEVCRKLRRKFPVEELPVVFISARHQADDILAGFEAGASDFLPRSHSKQELLERVKVHLRLLSARRHLVKTHSDLETALSELQHKNEELIRAHQKLVIQEKMATIGTLASGIVHELKNPANYTHICVQSLEEDLQSFRSYLLELAGDEADPELIQALEQRLNGLFELVHTVQGGTMRLKEIALNLSGFSRMGRGERRYVAIVDCLHSTIALVKARYRTNVTFHTDLHDPLETMCRPAELSQVFMNLMVNACQAVYDQRQTEGSQEKGDLWISTHLNQCQGHIVFRDSGGGVDPQHLGHIFEPFFTTKREGEGTGLGLSICRQIVEEHGGRLELDSIPGRGSTFTVVLPIVPEEAALEVDSSTWATSESIQN